jgi:hypothetical protein
MTSRGAAGPRAGCLHAGGQPGAHPGAQDGGVDCLQDPADGGLIGRLEPPGQRKYKRLRPFRKALRWWARLTERPPRMFAHWAWMPDLSSGYG